MDAPRQRGGKERIYGERDRARSMRPAGGRDETLAQASRGSRDAPHALLVRALRVPHPLPRCLPPCSSAPRRPSGDPFRLPHATVSAPTAPPSRKESRYRENVCVCVCVCVCVHSRSARPQSRVRASVCVCAHRCTSFSTSKFARMLISASTTAR